MLLLILANTFSEDGLDTEADFFAWGSSTFLFLFSTTGTAMALFLNSSLSFNNEEFIFGLYFSLQAM